MAKRGRPRKQLEAPAEFKNTEIPMEAENTASDKPVEKETVKKETLPQGYILCKADLQGERIPDTYAIMRDGIVYRFNAPDYTCALPEEFAKIYDGDPNHIISIVK